MAISISTDRTDEIGKELLTYGTEDFPIAFFDDDLSKVKVPWHWHDELEIVIILSGEVIVSFRGKEYLLKEKEGYFANSSILHCARLQSETGWQHALVFDPRVIAHPGDLIWKQYVSPLFSNEKIPYLRLSKDLEWQRKIIELSEKAWQYGAYEKKDFPLIVRSCLSEVFSQIISHMDEISHDYSNINEIIKEDERIKKCLHFIDRHYMDDISIDDIANNCDISGSTLLRLFRKMLHTTPIQYLMKYRLNWIAALLISEDKLSISQIAYANGFNDISYFNRCFLKEFGMTPSEYRKKSC